MTELIQSRKPSRCYIFLDDLDRYINMLVPKLFFSIKLRNKKVFLYIPGKMKESVRKFLGDLPLIVVYVTIIDDQITKVKECSLELREL